MERVHAFGLFKRAAVEASGGTLDFEGWKAAIKESGGAAFGEMLGRYIGADGKMHLFAA